MNHILEKINEKVKIKVEEPNADKTFTRLAPRKTTSDQHIENHSKINSFVTDTRKATNTHMKRTHHIQVTRLSPNYNFTANDDIIGSYQPYSNNQGGANFDQNFFYDTTLSPSSFNMYHHHTVNTCPSSSSKIRSIFDDEFYNTSHEFSLKSNKERESILMRQALKSTSRNKKRRESIGGFKDVMEKRPASTPLLPRLTKSSTVINHTKLTSNGGNVKQQRRYSSLQQPLSQKDKQELASLLRKNKNDACFHRELDTNTEPQWDPHIDAFEILRAKITGITRSMQEFHVKELFQDEKRRNKKITATTSSPLITATNKIIRSDRRFSLTNSAFIGSGQASLISKHRRIRSQSGISFHNDDDHALKPSIDDKEEDNIKMTSPNLTALFFTTNNLINSRLDELSETASIQSSQDDRDQIASTLEWRNDFLSLVTNCIHQSEQLESLSTDLLNTEHRVRELMLINDTIHEQFNEREKQYEDRIRECQEVAQQQLIMIDSLEELNADINMKIESTKREAYRQEALLALNSQCQNNRDGSQYLDDGQQHNRWDFQKSIVEILSMDDKYDMIQKMRWDVGMVVGGGVGTGHIIHSYEDSDRLNGIDIMIAGTGTTTTAINMERCNDSGKKPHLNGGYNEYQIESYSITPSISHHIKLYQHQYVIYLSKEDRSTRFALLPKHLWVPDHDSAQCQFQPARTHKRCNIRFSFFQRKHHCRKCGYIMCQKHSANRLPLFSLKNNIFILHWSRVCDNCFQNLIIKK